MAAEEPWGHQEGRQRGTWETLCEREDWTLLISLPF